MRLSALFLAITLTACSSTTGSAPTAFRLADDGFFSTRGAVWFSSDRIAAAAAARKRLEAEAKARGYTHFLVEQVSNFFFFGQQVVMKGRLFRAAEAPATAEPLFEVFVPKPKPRPRPKKVAKAVEPAPRPEPAAVLPVEPAPEEPVTTVAPVEAAPVPVPTPAAAPAAAPVVIEAPEFVEEEPKKPVR